FAASHHYYLEGQTRLSSALHRAHTSYNAAPPLSRQTQAIRGLSYRLLHKRPACHHPPLAILDLIPRGLQAFLKIGVGHVRQVDQAHHHVADTIDQRIPVSLDDRISYLSNFRHGLQCLRLWRAELIDPALARPLDHVLFKLFHFLYSINCAISTPNGELYACALLASALARPSWPAA